MFYVSIQGYTQVNEMFADRTMHALHLLQKDKPANITPLIWIHDYHLMLMANWVRQVGFNIHCMQSVVCHI
jgi:trehalose 6-phosphate synthase/phosphatase